MVGPCQGSLPGCGGCGSRAGSWGGLAWCVGEVHAVLWGAAGPEPLMGSPRSLCRVPGSGKPFLCGAVPAWARAGVSLCGEVDVLVLLGSVSPALPHPRGPLLPPWLTVTCLPPLSHPDRPPEAVAHRAAPDPDDDGDGSPRAIPHQAAPALRPGRGGGAALPELQGEPRQAERARPVCAAGARAGPCSGSGAACAMSRCPLPAGHSHLAGWDELVAVGLWV